MLRVAFAAFLFAVLALPALAEHTSSPAQLNGNDRTPHYFTELTQDLSIQAAAPFTMHRTDLYCTGAAALVTAALFETDIRNDAFFKKLRERNSTVAAVSPAITEFGGKYALATSAVFTIGAFICNDKKAIETSRLLSEALITSTVWTRVAKLATGRQRPFDYYSNGGSTWFGPLAEFSEKGESRPGSCYDAFPSGHTATAFAVATVFARQYSDHPVVPVIAYTLASAVGVSRMIEHEHWSSDVFVGGLLGYLCARQVCRHAAPSVSPTATVHRKLHPSCFVNYERKTWSGGAALRF